MKVFTFCVNIKRYLSVVEEKLYFCGVVAYSFYLKYLLTPNYILWTP